MMAGTRSRCERMHETLLDAGVPATWFPNAIYVRRHPAALAPDRPGLPHRQPQLLPPRPDPALEQPAARPAGARPAGHRGHHRAADGDAPAAAVRRPRPPRPAGGPGARLRHPRAVGYDRRRQLAPDHGAGRHPGRQPGAAGLHRAPPLWPRRHARHPARGHPPLRLRGLPVRDRRGPHGPRHRGRGERGLHAARPERRSDGRDDPGPAARRRPSGGRHRRGAGVGGRAPPGVGPKPDGRRADAEDRRPTAPPPDAGDDARHGRRTLIVEAPPRRRNRL